MSEYRVEKQSYSRNPWRVLDDGGQVYAAETFDHPNIGRTLIYSPVCFPRKRDALAWIKAQEQSGAASMPGCPR